MASVFEEAGNLGGSEFYAVDDCLGPLYAFGWPPFLLCHEGFSVWAVPYGQGHPFSGGWEMLSAENAGCMGSAIYPAPYPLLPSLIPT